MTADELAALTAARTEARTNLTSLQGAMAQLSTDLSTKHDSFVKLSDNAGFRFAKEQAEAAWRSLGCALEALDG